MTTFGEITEPGSRTAWEDWDETEIIPVNSLPLQWQKDVEWPKEIDTFILLEGSFLADYLKSQSKFELVYINSIPEVNLHLYNTKANNFICVIKDYNLIWSSEIVELLKDYITLSKNVLAVLTKPLVEHQVAEVTNKSYIMRTLSTSIPQKYCELNFPKLEQPNIISGVAAGVVCLRENLDLPAMAVVCYHEQPEDHQIFELHELLQKLNIVSNIGPIQNENNILNSNLYI